jgi:hypothetical protein
MFLGITSMTKLAIYIPQFSGMCVENEGIQEYKINWYQYIRLMEFERVY